MSGSGCPGELLSALVDGELDHPSRERAQRHLAHCPGCRAEAEELRRLKLQLRGAAHPPPPEALLARLAALPAAQGAQGVQGVRVAPAGRSRGATRRRDRRASGGTRVVARRAVALAGVGVAVAVAIGTPRPVRSSTPVDPATPTFLTDYASTTAEIPLSDPVSDAVPVVDRMQAGR